MARKMKNAPVYFTIAQVRFNALLALDSYAPSIQENLRKEGYPDFQKGVLATFNLNIGGASEGTAPQVPVAQATRYTFGDMNRTACFILDQAALTFQATEYDVFETFSASFLKGLSIVHAAVGLNYSERTGVRYLDAVYPKEGESLSDYLTSSVLGLVGKLDSELVHSFCETVTKSGVGNVTARTIIHDGAVVIPPDLQPMPLQLPERFRDLKGLHAMLDTDGSYEWREPFDLKNLEKRLILIHDEVDKSFKATVTEHALKIWE
jgi:uncharacterized protein (TIGR04255 family)